MRISPTQPDERELFARSERCEPVRVNAQEVRYLDMSGDGAPDAVEYVTRSSFRAHASSLINTIEEHRRLEYGIGLDGKPAGVIERTNVFVREGAGRFSTTPPGASAVA